MFGWASQQIEKISQTMAPPPTDPPSRFAQACQQSDEPAALALLYELPGAGCVVQSSNGQVPLHLACLYGLPQLFEACLSQPGADLNALDQSRNTPLHCASMSQAPAALSVVQNLVNRGASVLAKNLQGQTPYDVAKLNNVRQYLLPIQLQQETQQMIDNGGAGLPPGIDMGGLKIANSHLPPPPQGMPAMTSLSQGSAGGVARYAPPPMPGAMAAAPASGPVPAQQPMQHQVVPATAAPAAQAPPQTAPAPATGPAVANGAYARSGHSSAAVLSTAKYRPDGFHSSSSDKSLQRKYGHSSSSLSSLPPPPSSGNAPPPAVNPFAGGANTINRKGGMQYYNPNAGSAPRPAYPVPQTQPVPQYANFASPSGVAPAPASQPAPLQPVSAVGQVSSQISPSGFLAPPARTSFPVPPVRGSSLGAPPAAVAAPLPSPSVTPSGFPAPPIRQNIPSQPVVSNASAASVFSSPSSVDTPPKASRLPAANAAAVFGTPSPEVPIRKEISKSGSADAADVFGGSSPDKQPAVESSVGSTPTDAAVLFAAAGPAQTSADAGATEVKDTPVDDPLLGTIADNDGLDDVPLSPAEPKQDSVPSQDIPVAPALE